MKKALLLIVIMFGMNVIAQEECKVKVIITIENAIDSTYTFYSSNIGEKDKVIYENATIYTLNTNESYRFIFSNSIKDKVYLLDTSTQCGNILYLIVDMEKEGSLASFWENNRYIHKYFNNERY